MEQENCDYTGRSMDLHNSDPAASVAVTNADIQPSGQNNNPNINLDTAHAAHSAEFRALVLQTQAPLAPFSHPPLVFRRSTIGRFRDQPVQEVISVRDSDRGQTEDRPTQIRPYRARPGSSRSRSRSRTVATRPINYRDRSQEPTLTRHQDSSALDYGTEGQAVLDPAEVARRLRMDKLQKEKNDYTVCITCWRKGLPCDRQWPCRECKTRGEACGFIVCPLNYCPLDHKCPCYHKHKPFPQETPPRKLYSHMHLIALLDLDCFILQSHDMSNIQTKLQDPSSAQQIYLQLQHEIEHTFQQEQGFHYHEFRKLLLGSGKVTPPIGRRLRAIAKLIVELVKERKKNPFRELWKHAHRQRKFASEAAGQTEAQDTPMSDADR